MAYHIMFPLLFLAAGPALGSPFFPFPNTTSSSAALLRPRQEACDLPTTYEPTTIAKLPDPFTFADGTPVDSLASWSCRQDEISAMLQQFELGTYPPAPDSLTATLSGSTINAVITVGSASVTLSATINSRPGTSPGPAIIAIGGSSIPTPSGVGLVTFGNDAWAAQSGGSSRGQGQFYTLFGASHPAGALAAWAWGVERLVDALELLGPGATGIDASRLGVTGCSRNGKGAFVVGALLRGRIALTIPQESGAGGAACWRVSDDEKAKGKNIQTASQIVGENVWFGTAFNQYVNSVPTLPFDHHLLAGLVAPNGLLVLENDIDWLGPVSTTACMRAGRMVYEGVGEPTGMGFSLVGGHNHCQFPSSQQSILDAYVDYYLKGGSTAPPQVDESPASVDMGLWVDWDVPALE